jgi:GNAT superfamily N-acetyltransferase
MVTISSPTSKQDFKAYYKLRWKILRQPWNQPPGSEKDKLEITSKHFIAISNCCIVAVGRLHLENYIAVIRYMGVDNPYQGQGIGTKLLTYIENEAVNLNVTTIKLNAREEFINFYLQNGYTDCGAGHTLYHTIHHRKMIKYLP